MVLWETKSEAQPQSQLELNCYNVLKVQFCSEHDGDNGLTDTFMSVDSCPAEKGPKIKMEKG